MRRRLIYILTQCFVHSLARKPGALNNGVVDERVAQLFVKAYGDDAAVQINVGVSVLNACAASLVHSLLCVFL